MAHRERLSSEFEGQREHLRSLALGILGSRSDADDAVQETWLRLAATDAEAIDNLAGWLTTVTSRVSLDMLRARRARPSTQLTSELTESMPSLADDPERAALMADAIGSALVVLLDTLRPAERLAFVLHDVFGFPFEEIGAILGRSQVAAKQLASRARAKMRGSSTVTGAQAPVQTEVVEAFLAASRRGEFNALLSVLDQEVTLAADVTVARMGVPSGVSGAEHVAALFTGRAQDAQPVLVDGQPGLVWTVRGQARLVWDFIVQRGRIVHINMLAAAATIARLDLEPVPQPAAPKKE
jgi:RNA polymerase sigma factor (sigma-70 family)